jgi:hypothetical protein
MRFGLSDVDELPSLKEFEQLARAALGADEGIAPIEPEVGPEAAVSPSADSAASASNEVTGSEQLNPGAPESPLASEPEPESESGHNAAKGAT